MSLHKKSSFPHEVSSILCFLNCSDGLCKSGSDDTFLVSSEVSHLSETSFSTFPANITPDRDELRFKGAILDFLSFAFQSCMAMIFCNGMSPGFNDSQSHLQRPLHRIFRNRTHSDLA